MTPCDVGRERVHAHFDETPGATYGYEAEYAAFGLKYSTSIWYGSVSRVPSDDLATHLAECPGCRSLFEELSAVRAALAAMPRHALPAETLDEIWKRTVREPRARFLGGKRVALAAAVLVTAVSATTLYLLRSPVPSGPSSAEIARAQAQADLVLSYTARALAATRAAAKDTVGSKVSPAVRGEVPPDIRRH